MLAVQETNQLYSSILDISNQFWGIPDELLKYSLPWLYTWPFIINIDLKLKLISGISLERVQIEDPRLEWRALQEDMLRQYLVTAQDDLTNKQELVTIKQQRLSLAKDEFQHLNTTLTALSNSTTSCKYTLWLEYSSTLSHARFNSVTGTQIFTLRTILATPDIVLFLYRYLPRGLSSLHRI